MIRRAGALAISCVLGCGGAAEVVHPAPHAADPKTAPAFVRAPDDEGIEPVDRRPSFAPNALPDEKVAAERLERLEKSAAPEKWNWVPPGRTERYGHSEVLVRAPQEAVRAIITDVARYKELAPGRFKTSRVVDKHEGSADLYIQIPVLHGLLVLWQVVRFEDLRTPVAGLEIVEGRLVKGNVKNMNIVVVSTAVDPARTLVSCDILIEPLFAAPQSAVDEETRDACGDALSSVRERAEHPLPP